MAEQVGSSTVKQSSTKPAGRWRSLIALAFAFVIDGTESGLA